MRNKRQECSPRRKVGKRRAMLPPSRRSDTASDRGPDTRRFQQRFQNKETP